MDGHAAAHIHSLFNPDDQQDVKLAFDLLKDIWSLPPLPESPPSDGESANPGFQKGREALHVLG